MKYIFYIFFLITFCTNGQETITTTLIEKKGLYINNFAGIDNFEAIYYTNENTFFKRINSQTKMYANVQFGNISSVNIFNPLKINLFYREFNSAVILDNRLAEIFRIDFNRLKDYKNVSHISTGHDNTLWVYNQDNLQLELYDYKNNTTRATTLPIAETILDLKSDYNYVWLLTEKHLYCYNYFGSLVKKTLNKNYEALKASNESLVLKKDNTLVFIKKDSDKILPIELPELLIKQFFVIGETLYIYNGELLHQFQLTFN